MKRTVLGILVILNAAYSPAQGWIAFDNYGINSSPMAPVYGPESGNVQLQKWGNAPDATPPGTQTYTGQPLTGVNYSVEGWYSLTPVSDVFGLNTAASPVPRSLTSFYPIGGFFDGGPLVVPETIHINGYGAVYLQVRAWDNGGGQYNSWTAAWNAALSGNGKAVGWSKVFWQPVNPGLGQPYGLYNFESFNIFIVPEPSALALIGLGGLSLWLFRRRN
jgi:hypothetical protein